MKRFFFLSVLVYIRTSKAFSAPPEFLLDLSKTPHERWQGAVGLILQQNSFESSFGATFASHNDSLFKNINSSTYEIISSSVEKYFPEMADELRGISEDFLSHGYDVSFSYLAAWSWFHELAHTELATELLQHSKSCTAIIAQDVNGNIVHGRNMDQSPLEVRNITLRIEVVNGSAQVLTAIDWYWFSGGFMTAVKRGVASVQENWRVELIPAISVLEAIQANRATPQILAFRNALIPSTVTTFDQVAATLCGTQALSFAAPEYIAIGGIRSGEGLVCARDVGTAVVWTRSLSQPTADEVTQVFSRKPSCPKFFVYYIDSIMALYGPDKL